MILDHHHSINARVNMSHVKPSYSHTYNLPASLLEMLCLLVILCPPEVIEVLEVLCLPEVLCLFEMLCLLRLLEVVPRNDCATKK